jgi:hypothetical protein
MGSSLIRQLEQLSLIRQSEQFSLIRQSEQLSLVRQLKQLSLIRHLEQLCNSQSMQALHCPYQYRTLSWQFSNAVLCDVHGFNAMPHFSS